MSQHSEINLLLDGLRTQVDGTILEHGGYWPAPRIFERIVEEVGELARARRPQEVPCNDPDRKHSEEKECCDIIFTVIAYANERKLNLSEAWYSVITAPVPQSSNLAG